MLTLCAPPWVGDIGGARTHAENAIAISNRTGFVLFVHQAQRILDSLRNESTGGRVAPGRCLPGAPTDPDVQNSRIRLFETRFRYARAARAGVSSG